MPLRFLNSFQVICHWRINDGSFNTPPDKMIRCLLLCRSRVRHHLTSKKIVLSGESFPFSTPVSQVVPLFRAFEIPTQGSKTLCGCEVCLSCVKWERGLPFSARSTLEKSTHGSWKCGNWYPGTLRGASVHAPRGHSLNAPGLEWWLRIPHSLLLPYFWICHNYFK